MRGFPLLNLLAVLALLAGVLVPLLRLNTPARADSGPTSQASGGVLPTVPILISIRFASAPSRAKVRVEGQRLELTGSGLERQARGEVVMHDGSLELDVEATWPEGIPGTMAEISVAPDGLDERKQNVWAQEGEVSEILRFDWRN